MEPRDRTRRASGGLSARAQGRPAPIRVHAPFRRGGSASAVGSKFALYAGAPADVRKSYARLGKIEAARSQEHGKSPRNVGRVAELDRERSSLAGASSPVRLLLGRYLARGGKIPIGRTVLLHFSTFVSDAEYGVFGDPAEPAPVPRFAALRCEDETLEIVLEGSRDLDLWRTWSTQIDVGLEPPPTEETTREIGRIDWNKVAAPPLGPYGGYRIGDVLGWMHRLTGRPTVGIAPRIGMPRKDENLVYSLTHGPVRVSFADGVFLATSAFGDGLWPVEMDRLESLPSPTIESVAAFCAGASPVWDALLAREYGQIASKFRVPLQRGLPVLRLLGSASPELLARFRTERRIVLPSLAPAAGATLARFLYEDARPATAIARAMARTVVIAPEFREAETVVFSTATGFETQIDRSTLESHPEIRRGLPAEFDHEAPGTSDRFTIRIGESDGRPSDEDVDGIAISRATGPMEPRKR